MQARKEKRHVPDSSAVAVSRSDRVHGVNRNNSSHLHLLCESVFAPHSKCIYKTNRTKKKTKKNESARCCCFPNAIGAARPPESNFLLAASDVEVVGGSEIDAHKSSRSPLFPRLLVTVEGGDGNCESRLDESSSRKRFQKCIRLCVPGEREELSAPNM